MSEMQSPIEAIQEEEAFEKHIEVELASSPFGRATDASLGGWSECVGLLIAHHNRENLPTEADEIAVANQILNISYGNRKPGTFKDFGTFADALHLVKESSKQKLIEKAKAANVS